MQLETKLDELNGILEKQNSLIGMIINNNLERTDISKIRDIVLSGNAPDVFNVGDQLIIPWTDNETTYDMPFDIVGFKDVTLESGTVVENAMILQSHYSLPTPIQFDANEAFYVVTDTQLPAGTYHFNITTSWGTNVVSGKQYEFTLTAPVPVGGQLVLTQGLPDTSPANWKVTTYSSSTSTTAIETVAVAEGASGTNLGDLNGDTKYGTSGINNLYRSGYGYNRWSQSAARQYLNSSEDIGAWWKPQNAYDRPPNELKTKCGFMKGFDEDFLNVLKPVKVTTLLNTRSDSDIGTSEDTYDTFFLPSLEEMYCVPQVSGVEGSYLPYWKERSGLSTPNKQYSTNAKLRVGVLNNHSTFATVRLRSANRSSAGNTWSVYSSGYISGNYAATSDRFAPLCVIC